MDCWYDVDGSCQNDKTGLYVPNEYIAQIVDEFPDCFEGCMSVHPYRQDSLVEMEKWALRGFRMVKWLPNSMGMDPSHEKCGPYYDKMRELGLVLLTHVGAEHSVDVGGVIQEYGNPLLLRSPLNKGVKVIAAHCASEGKNRDLDDPSKPYLSNFQLLYRLMNDPRYDDLLFADVSSMTAFLRVGEPLSTMLEREDLHHRLIQGSDYPVPAINLVVWTWLLVYYGFITNHERQLLNEIYSVNPVLFDFVCKRTIKSPANHKKFSPCVFTHNLKVFPKNL